MTSPGETAPLNHRLRILVVDDNRDAAESLNILLTTWGQDARVAHDAIAALEVAASFHPDVVLLDLGLPKLHGYDVARRLREHEWGRPALIVAVTGWGQEADRLQSKGAGIDHHFVKPVDPMALRQLLSKFQPRSGNERRSGIRGPGSGDGFPDP